MTVAKKTDDEVWFRGYGPDQYVCKLNSRRQRLIFLTLPTDYALKGPKKFLGGTFLVESYEDLERATTLPGSSDIQTLVDAPGGGFFVTVHDPEGFPINLIYGQAEREASADEQPGQLPHNFENEKPRVREFLRFKSGPAAVHKVRPPSLTEKFRDSPQWNSSWVITVFASKTFLASSTSTCRTSTLCPPTSSTSTDPMAPRKTSPSSPISTAATTTSTTTRFS